MNYKELLYKLCYQPAVRKTPPVSFSSTDLEVTRQKTYLNDSLIEICSDKRLTLFDKSAFISTIANQQSYDKPDGIIKSVYLDGKALKFIDGPDCLDSSTGQPSGYFLSGGQIGLYPNPDNVYSVKVNYITPLVVTSADGTLQDSLINETDFPLIPERFQDLIVLGAELVYMRDKNKNLQSAMLRYQRRFNQFIDYDRGTVENTPFISIEAF